MKRRIGALLVALCCCMLCMLSSCGKTDPLPAESDPEGSTAIVSSPDQIGDDEKQKIASALLSAFFAGEFSAVRGDGAYEWISPERVQEFREQVKTVGKPFLTEETVLQIAEAAAAFYVEAQENEQGIILPAYGAVEGIYFPAASEYTWFEEHEERYNALLAYTLYLFTPPKYAFSEEEVGIGWFPDSPPQRLPSCLYLALAGEYDTWRDALTALQEQIRGVILYGKKFTLGTQAPDFSYCKDPCALLWSSDEYRVLGLADEVDLSGTVLGALYAEELLKEKLQALFNGSMAMHYYETPEGEPMIVLLQDDLAAEIRTLTEQVTRPVMEASEAIRLAWEYKIHLENSLERLGLPILLPDADGTGEVLLDPEVLGKEVVKRRALAYLIDLATPSAYRFTDLTPARGTYYVPAGAYNTPEEAITALSFGAWFLLADEEGVLCLVDAEGNTQPLDTYGAVLYGEEALIP